MCVDWVADRRWLCQHDVSSDLVRRSIYYQLLPWQQRAAEKHPPQVDDWNVPHERKIAEDTNTLLKIKQFNHTCHMVQSWLTWSGGGRLQGSGCVHACAWFIPVVSEEGFRGLCVGCGNGGGGGVWFDREGKIGV